MRMGEGVVAGQMISAKLEARGKEEELPASGIFSRA